MGGAFGRRVGTRPRHARAALAVSVAVVCAGCFDFGALEAARPPDAGAPDAPDAPATDAPPDAPATPDAGPDAPPCVESCAVVDGQQTWTRCVDGTPRPVRCALSCNPADHPSIGCQVFAPKYWAAAELHRLREGLDDVQISEGATDHWVVHTGGPGVAPRAWAYPTRPLFSRAEDVGVGGSPLALPLGTVTLEDGRVAALLLTRRFAVDRRTVLLVTGARPFVVVATEGASVDGIIDAGGGALGRRIAGPGASGEQAQGGQAAPGSPCGKAFATGGAGGSRGGRGGDAGGTVLTIGLDCTAAPAVAGTGTALHASTATALVGGQAGGDSVAYLDANAALLPGDAPRGGPAGGALQLIALGDLSVGEHAELLTVGGGGLGGARGDDGFPEPNLHFAGGGGGGAGGVLVLEASSFSFASGALLSAAGGGGGGGSFTQGSGMDLVTDPGSDGMRGNRSDAVGGAGGGILTFYVRGGHSAAGDGTAMSADGANSVILAPDGMIAWSGGGGGGGHGFVVLRTVGAPPDPAELVATGGVSFTPSPDVLSPVDDVTPLVAGESASSFNP